MFQACRGADCRWQSVKVCDSCLSWLGRGCWKLCACELEKRGVGGWGDLSGVGVSHRFELPKLLLTTPLSVWARLQWVAAVFSKPLCLEARNWAEPVTGTSLPSVFPGSFVSFAFSEHPYNYTVSSLLHESNWSPRSLLFLISQTRALWKSEWNHRIVSSAKRKKIKSKETLCSVLTYLFLSTDLDKASSYFLGRKNNICCYHCPILVVWVCVPAPHHCPEEHILLHPNFFSEGISGSQPASMPWIFGCWMQSLLPSLNGMQTEGEFEKAAFWFCGRWCAKFVNIQAYFLKFVLYIILSIALVSF